MVRLLHLLNNAVIRRLVDNPGLAGKCLEQRRASDVDAS